MRRGRTGGTPADGAGRVLRGIGIALTLALAAGCGEARDAEPTPPPARISGAGHMLYLTYCQGCHGTGGAGDGPAAASLRTPPADLTQLWQRYGAPLDRERVGRYIDGRELFGGHDPREMPIWGDEFFEDVPPTTPDLENAKHRLIEVLVEYLETLQARRGA